MLKSFFRQNPVTTGFLILIIGVYLATSYPQFQHPSDWAITWGILYPGALAVHEYWRILTASLMHVGWGHLGNNAFGAFVFGQMLEPMIGSRHLISLLAFVCITCGVSSALFLTQPTLGASGLVYAMTGGYFTLILLLVRLTEPSQFKAQLRSGLILLGIFLYTSWYEQVSINSLAHLVGLVSGSLYAGLFYWDRRHQLKAYLGQAEVEQPNLDIQA